MPTGTVRGALAIACLLVLAGCSDDPPRTGSVPTRSASPAPSSSTPSLTPEQQVEAAVRAYYAELTRAARTNDTSRLRTMASKGCPCYRPVTVIDRNTKRDLRTPDARFELTRIRVHDINGQTALAEVRTAEAAYEVLNSAGQVVGRVPARSNFLDLTVVQAGDGRWVVHDEFDLMGS